MKKALEKEIKTIEKEGEKQVETLQSLKPNKQQMQIYYQPQMKLYEDLFPK